MDRDSIRLRPDDQAPPRATAYPQPQDPVDLRGLMTGFPTGVCVVTALDGAEPWGMTCTSLCSVALDPPTLLVCLREGSPTLAAVRASGAFAVNLLHDEAQPSAELFASGAADRFDRVHWEMPVDACGPHLVRSAHTVADCVVSDSSRVGDHVVTMGRVRRTTRLRSQQPLLYGLRRYATWPQAVDDSHRYFDHLD
ncbi:flavin reductase family protein [Streptomyces sp. NPDC001848]|uniref:flavin reductase family protein n=1 Tax=Streptomyces sp. NPDC001848 TaxID=3364618 RepID=UPI0036B48D71